MISKNGPVPHSLKKPIFGSQETRFMDLGLLHGLTKLQWLNYINDLKKWSCPTFFEEADFRKSRKQVLGFGSPTRTDKITVAKLHKWSQKLSLSHILWRSRFLKVKKPGSWIWVSYTDWHFSPNWAKCGSIWPIWRCWCYLRRAQSKTDLIQISQDQHHNCWF